MNTPTWEDEFDEKFANKMQPNFAVTPMQRKYLRMFIHRIDQEARESGLAKRCAKCGSPFQEHHWRHFAPKTGEIFHTGCFEQYKFPSLLQEARDDERRKALSIIKKLEACTGSKSEGV